MDFGYLHLPLNHIPVLGVVFGSLVLLGGIIARSPATRRTGLITLFLCGIIAIPVYLTGEPAEDVVEHLPGVSDPFIEAHESAAGISLALAIITGMIAMVLVPFTRKATSKFQVALPIAVLLLSIVTGGSLLMTAKLGGEIRHTEARSGTQQRVPNSETNEELKRNGKKSDDDD